MLSGRKGHSTFSTVLPLIIMTTGKSFGTPPAIGVIAASARPAGEGMLRTVIPSSLYRNSIRLAGAFNAMSVG